MNITIPSISLLVLVVIGLGPRVTATAQTSGLWGNNGELWDAVNGPLRDFTNAEYLSGTVAIPDENDWPVEADVTSFGAIPNDGLDDSTVCSLADVDLCRSLTPHTLNEIELLSSVNCTR